MKVEVKYFARFREITGTESETVSTAASDISGLLADIFRIHPALTGEQNMLIALNESFADGGASISDGDRIAVLPPVSGG